ncbi:zf-HC2 domain-containing protein [Alkaliphilus sp. MSJ-5]|uniref:Zf-HC2 domain-containing protein n=1 Tax=Alkaliphilus flagellatus TaxID=2841507 RepID=A0ABS6G5J0_9FIRM|nr:zf-HC2 domain-containing protein [Alkaliphilus flagellatus]MBU5676888.1 zf-HC2 domain-containing protein [Alkaliphilus flagellatus]
MKCEIIQDLLPSYIDDLTSSESNLEIEEHLKNCPQCKEIFEQMKAEVKVENIEYNKEKIKPFKKLNRKVFRAVLITLTVCVLAVGSYVYFFGIGWKVNSDDMNIEYSYKNGIITFEFELTNGRVLNAWTSVGESDIKFTESFSSSLDDRGEYPNQFYYGIHYINDKGNIREFTDDDCVILHFKDTTKTLYLKEIAKELGIQ